MYLKIVLLGFLVLIVFDFIHTIDALDENGVGVCIVKQSSRQRKKKTFNAVINKWCGNRRCIVRKYKYETYLAWKNHTVCCKGWQYENELDICTPICSIDCRGGKCVGPDQCKCQEPSYIDTTNTCITPKCNPECVNADCYQNNTCICESNFTQFNSTHCFNCNKGYTADKDFLCVPECKPTCINGNCIAPNTCRCSPGFYSKNSSVCERKKECVNSQWIPPNNCSCNLGYTLVNKTCVPKCDNCLNGDCLSPNNCSCHKGYVSVGGLCRPICSVPCVNGYCSAPDVCSCNDGFVKISDWQCVMKKPCEGCEGYCDGDVCIPWDCSKPLNAM